MASAKRYDPDLPLGYNEADSKQRMLRFQDTLPHLPVPTLEETVSRYLKSLHPLLSAKEYAASKAAVEDFIRPGGIGSELQARLISRQQDPKIRSWIYGWWNEAAFLTSRGPVVPSPSYFYSYQDDSLRRDPSKRAASISYAVLEFKNVVDTKTLEPEMMKKMPACMNGYTWMFNTARTPVRPADVPVKYAPEENKHIIAIRKDNFFKIPHEIEGRQLSIFELESQFNKVYQLASQRGHAVGALTSANRDHWADAREQLLHNSRRNEEALKAVESASFVVCLDDASPVTREERSHQYWYGGVTSRTNRWYDKPLQFIVNDNGTAGFVGEHSMMDGTQTYRVNDYINHLIFSGRLNVPAASARALLPDPQLLEFEVTPLIQHQIVQAAKSCSDLVSQHQLALLPYQGHGKGLIKRFDCSPDAYCQMVIQLAYVKMHGKTCPTYESAATRRFLLGRTETCRSLSDESVAWCASMVDASQDDDHRRRLFRRAIEAHVEYTNAALAGKGVDRHFFGLRKLLRPGEDVPAIFTDPAFTYSSTWYLSTTQISSEYFNGLGESQSIDQGIGVSYNIKENSIIYNVISRFQGSDRMIFYIDEAAEEVRNLMMPTIASSSAKL